jgi:RHS repeat-associated protein
MHYLRPTALGRCRLPYLQTGSTVATMSYDGKGRRIKKAIANDADLDCTYLYYHDGDSNLETRNGSGYVLKQQVWGTPYVDELVQVGVNQDPDNANPSLPDNQEENLCERFFWTCQDANYNVLGVVYSTGVLSERYEYSPYGKRTTFSRGWLLADLDDDGSVGSSDEAIFNAVNNTTNPPHRADLDGDGDIDIGDFAIFAAAYGTSIATADPYAESPRAGGGSFRGRIDAGNATPLCEHGHQGLSHDEELGLVYNRARILVPGYGRFGGRDPMEYHDGASLYPYIKSNSINGMDPRGKCFVHYICMLTAQTSYCFSKVCTYRCIEDTTKPREQGGAGGVTCDDPRIPVIIIDSISIGPLSTCRNRRDIKTLTFDNHTHRLTAVSQHAWRM